MILYRVLHTQCCRANFCGSGFAYTCRFGIHYGSWRQRLTAPGYVYRCIIEISNLTHSVRVTHTRVSKLTITVSDNALSPNRCQAIVWTNAGILLIRTLGENFSEILSEIPECSFSFKKMHLEMSPEKRWPFCLGLNVLNGVSLIVSIPSPNAEKYVFILVVFCLIETSRKTYERLFINGPRWIGPGWRSNLELLGDVSNFHLETGI